MNDIIEQFSACFDASISVVSINVWDTLLLRPGFESDFVYKQTGKMAREQHLLPDWLTPDEFVHIRQHVGALMTEKSLKMSGTSSVSLQNIYDGMPRFIPQRDRIRQLEEFLCVQLCSLNGEVYNLVETLHESGKKLVAVCFSPYSISNVEKIMQQERVNPELFTRIYVSGSPVSKKSLGVIFDTIIGDTAIEPCECIHISTDLTEVGSLSKHLGIRSIYYDKARTSESASIEAERMVKGELCAHHAPLRRIISTQARSMAPDDAFWYRFGAGILGPVFSEFAEWVLQCAGQHQVDTIHPLMREGALLEKMLKNAAQKTEFSGLIQPLYVSRYVVMFAGKDKVDESLIRRLIVRRGVTLKRTFEIFGVEEESRRFQAYYDLEYYQYKNIDTPSGNIYDQVIAHLTAPARANRLLAFARHSVDMCRNYLIQTLGRNPMTVDIGYSGTIQRGMQRILGTHGFRKHLLLFASKIPTLKANITDDPYGPGTIDLQGFFDTYGAHAGIVEEIYWRNRFIELLMMDERGSTVGYREVSGRMEPELKSMESMTALQLRQIAICQKGILDYQKSYLSCESKTNGLQDTNKRAELLHIIHRVICHPTTEEATHLGQLLFDENNGADDISPICEESDIDYIREHGMDSLIQKKSLRNILWVEGLQAAACPDYFANNSLRTDSQNEALLRILFRKVIASGASSVVVCGAGESGRKIAVYLRQAGIHVEAFADNNASLHGLRIDNVWVYPLAHKFESIHYVVSSYGNRTALAGQIGMLKGSTCFIHTV